MRVTVHQICFPEKWTYKHIFLSLVLLILKIAVVPKSRFCTVVFKEEVCVCGGGRLSLWIYTILSTEMAFVTLIVPYFLRNILFSSLKNLSLFLKPKWDITSHLPEWLLSKRPVITMLPRRWRNEHPCALLVGMQIGVATVENSGEVPQKLNTEFQFTLHNTDLSCMGLLIRGFFFFSVNTCVVFDICLGVYRCEGPIVCIDLHHFM